LVVAEVVQPLLVGVVAVLLPSILFRMPLAVLFLMCCFHQMSELLVLFQLAENL
jgi:hypothetical protein